MFGWSGGSATLQSDQTKPCRLYIGLRGWGLGFRVGYQPNLQRLSTPSAAPFSYL